MRDPPDPSTAKLRFSWATVAVGLVVLAAGVLIVVLQKGVAGGGGGGGPNGGKGGGASGPVHQRIEGLM